MDPVLIKLREYKLSWSSLFGQKKKKKELGQYPAILISRLVNSTDEYISCRHIEIWQGKTVQKTRFRAWNLSKV